jgi:hypothetical protein
MSTQIVLFTRGHSLHQAQRNHPDSLDRDLLEEVAGLLNLCIRAISSGRLTLIVQFWLLPPSFVSFFTWSVVMMAESH